MTKKQDKYAEIVVKIPEWLAKMIEHENYFGKSKDEFFAKCVDRGVDCELNSLDLEEMRRLERKYKIESHLVVDLSKSTLLEDIASMDEEEQEQKDC
jgi:hypothetical protein